MTDELLEMRRKEELWVDFWMERGCIVIRLGLKRGDGSTNSSSEVNGVNEVDWALGLGN